MYLTGSHLEIGLLKRNRRAKTFGDLPHG
jgi:hypothetical protein